MTASRMQLKILMSTSTTKLKYVCQTVKSIQCFKQHRKHIQLLLHAMCVYVCSSEIVFVCRQRKCQQTIISADKFSNIKHEHDSTETWPPKQLYSVSAFREHLLAFVVSGSRHTYKYSSTNTHSQTIYVMALWQCMIVHTMLSLQDELKNEARQLYMLLSQIRALSIWLLSQTSGYSVARCFSFVVWRFKPSVKLHQRTTATETESKTTDSLECVT